MSAATMCDSCNRVHDLNGSQDSARIENSSHDLKATFRKMAVDPGPACVLRNVFECGTSRVVGVLCTQPTTPASMYFSISDELHGASLVTERRGGRGLSTNTSRRILAAAAIASVLQGADTDERFTRAERVRSKRAVVDAGADEVCFLQATDRSSFKKLLEKLLKDVRSVDLTGVGALFSNNIVAFAVWAADRTCILFFFFCGSVGIRISIISRPHLGAVYSAPSPLRMGGFLTRPPRPRLATMTDIEVDFGPMIDIEEESAALHLRLDCLHQRSKSSPALSSLPALSKGEDMPSARSSPPAERLRPFAATSLATLCAWLAGSRSKSSDDNSKSLCGSGGQPQVLPKEEDEDNNNDENDDKENDDYRGRCAVRRKRVCKLERDQGHDGAKQRAAVLVRTYLRPSDAASMDG
ncbi:hypothetical protein BAUCODRAFT_135109 [Baudoinia panamericana UAMH 10762]|uniref:Uncharacterized protein n=1 Tax=Baudoinia panamericana (strain UAMH 10762) TaxID=717646 RepID=M2MXB4_BAUPA|nr:uncharacterized protein BAUCODRAFT_135109 [Baudoinia panamericana UAMH 10762]EMC90895.1 hypothetical protein BAUCODRAFT_135109 [Baudoinia panamericana UAMH 10762]